MNHSRSYALAGLAVAGALYLHAPALGQGSMGGDIGKQDKSISGERDSARPSSRKAAPKRSGGGGFDGTWRSVAAGGSGCTGNTTTTVTVSGTTITTAEGVVGTVSGGGAVRVNWSGKGMTGLITGRLSGRSGQGTFTRSDGCTGTWAMVKQ